MTTMTLNQVRENWKADYQTFGKGSEQELKSYRLYVSISQGKDKSKTKRGRKGKTEVKKEIEPESYTND